MKPNPGDIIELLPTWRDMSIHRGRSVGLVLSLSDRGAAILWENGDVGNSTFSFLSLYQIIR
mgnify:CR=1 FL=1